MKNPVVTPTGATPTTGVRKSERKERKSKFDDRETPAGGKKGITELER